MAETLSYDNTPQTEVLSPEEQDSLEVGEKLVAEQEGLLAGKYNSAQELEKAYLELQSKFGKGETEVDEGEGEADDSELSEEAPETSPAYDLIMQASEEYYGNDNTLSEETISKFSEMSSTDLVNAYVESVRNNPAPQQQEVDIPDAQVNQIQNSVGGEKQYTNIVSWAANNLPEKQVLAYDNLVASGNVEAIGLALQGLKAQYDNAFGSEGRTLQGRSPRSNEGVFRSQAELMSAMNDPRYDSDEAYRDDVLRKLDASDLQF
tara:strand:+ start:381 stop:1169 length:789 start_codon:yes stop_codon:yes gene_type:complete